MTRATYMTPSDRATRMLVLELPHTEHGEHTVQEADEALIAFVHRTQQAHKAARIEAILREPDL